MWPFFTLVTHTHKHYTRACMCVCLCVRVRMCVRIYIYIYMFRLYIKCIFTNALMIKVHFLTTDAEPAESVAKRYAFKATPKKSQRMILKGMILCCFLSFLWIRMIMRVKEGGTIAIAFKTTMDITWLLKSQTDSKSSKPEELDERLVL